MSWVSSNLCPKCKYILKYHIHKELKRVVKYCTETTPLRQNIDDLTKLGFTAQMSGRILKRLSPNVIESRTFLTTAKLLQEHGFSNEDISSYPEVLHALPSFIKHRWQILEEAGFIKENIPLSWMKMPCHNKKLFSKVSELKSLGLISQHVDCARNIVSFTDLPEALYPPRTDDSLSFHYVQTRANQLCLQWKLSLSEKVIKEKYDRYPNLQMRSIRMMFQSIDTLIDYAGFSMERLVKNINLLQHDSERFLEVLREVPAIGDTAIQDVLKTHPRVIMRPASVIKSIIAILEEYKVPLYSLTRFASLLTLAPDTVRQRIDHLYNDPYYEPFFYDPRICKFIVQYSKVMRRTKELTESGWRCHSLELLSSCDKTYKDRVATGSERNKGSNTIHFLTKSLGKSRDEIHKLLTQHPLWPYAAVSTVANNFNYLQEAAVDKEHILQALPVLLYPTDALQKCFSELESLSEVDCCRGTDGNIRPELKLQLLLYYLERPFKFTGNGIWDQQPKKEPTDLDHDQ